MRIAAFASAILFPLSGLVAACGGATGSSSAASATLPSRAAIERRLSARLETDPNRTVCERVASAFAAGNRDALRPLFDFASLVERIVAHGGVPRGPWRRLKPETLMLSLETRAFR
ncbi:MAG: hypothetical protein WCJ30_03615 [Deltaproteobacteria bacterium]